MSMLFILVNNVAHRCWDDFVKTGMIYHVPSAMNKVVGSTCMNNMLPRAWTVLLVQQPCWNMILVLFKGCWINNVVQSCDVFARVDQVYPAQFCLNGVFICGILPMQRISAHIFLHGNLLISTIGISTLVTDNIWTVLNFHHVLGTWYTTAFLKPQLSQWCAHAVRVSARQSALPPKFWESCPGFPALHYMSHVDISTSSWTAELWNLVYALFYAILNFTTYWARWNYAAGFVPAPLFFFQNYFSRFFSTVGVPFGFGSGRVLGVPSDNLNRWQAAGYLDFGTK